VKREPETSIEITVRDEVVAELRAAQPVPAPGAAATALLAVMRRLPRHRGRKTAVSSRVKQPLYGVDS